MTNMVIQPIMSEQSNSGAAQGIKHDRSGLCAGGEIHLVALSYIRYFFNGKVWEVENE